MSAKPPDCPNSLVPVGLSIPMLDVAALDALAEIKGVTRSAMVRAVIIQGLEVFLQ